MASFTEHPFFSQYRTKSADMRKETPLHGVYHICGEGVLEDEQYKEFMSGFSNETHVRIHADYMEECNSCIHAAYRVLKRTHSK